MELRLLLTKRFALFPLLLFLFIPCMVKAQGSTVSGKITDENGIGVPGVTVQVKGTTKTTTTSADGVFKLSDLTGKETLLITSVGYNDQQISINGKTTINVSLIVAQKTLDDVIMIGYGAAKKSDLTGSLSRMTADEILLYTMKKNGERKWQGTNERGLYVPAVARCLFIAID